MPGSFGRIIAIAESSACLRFVEGAAREEGERINAPVELRVVTDIGAWPAELLKIAGPDDLVVAPHARLCPSYARIAPHLVRSLRSSILFASRGHRPSTIVAATDLEDPLLPALSAAWRIAHQLHVRLATLHCVRPSPSVGELSFPMSPFDAAPRLVHPDDRAPRARLEAAHRRLGISGDVEPIVRPGAPADEISTLAAQTRSGLVVVGSHRRRGLRRLVLGSVSEETVLRVEQPVLVVSHSVT